MSCRNVWYRLFEYATGQQLSQTNADKVFLSESEDVADFRDAVKKKNPNKLSSVDAPDLIVYANESAFKKRNSAEGKEQPLDPSLSIGEQLGNSTKEALIVVVPSMSSSELNEPNLSVTQQIKRAIPSDVWFPTEFSKRAKMNPGDEFEDEQGELRRNERLTKY